MIRNKLFSYSDWWVHFSITQLFSCTALNLSVFLFIAWRYLKKSSVKMSMYISFCFLNFQSVFDALFECPVLSAPYRPGILVSHRGIDGGTLGKQLLPGYITSFSHDAFFDEICIFCAVILRRWLTIFVWFDFFRAITATFLASVLLTSPFPTCFWSVRCRCIRKWPRRFAAGRASKNAIPKTMIPLITWKWRMTRQKRHLPVRRRTPAFTCAWYEPNRDLTFSSTVLWDLKHAVFIFKEIQFKFDFHLFSTYFPPIFHLLLIQYNFDLSPIYF